MNTDSVASGVFNALSSRSDIEAEQGMHKNFSEKGQAVMQSVIGLLAKGAKDPSGFFMVIYQAYAYLDASISMIKNRLPNDGKENTINKAALAPADKIAP